MSRSRGGRNRIYEHKPAAPNQCIPAAAPVMEYLSSIQSAITYRDNDRLKRLLKRIDISLLQQTYELLDATRMDKPELNTIIEDLRERIGGEKLAGNITSMLTRAYRYDLYNALMSGTITGESKNTTDEVEL